MLRNSCNLLFFAPVLRFLRFRAYGKECGKTAQNTHTWLRFRCQNGVSACALLASAECGRKDKQLFVAMDGKNTHTWLRFSSKEPVLATFGKFRLLLNDVCSVCCLWRKTKPRVQKKSKHRAVTVLALVV